jgi:hypothetical protein
MADMPEPARPFRVVVAGNGNMHSGHMTLEDAQKRAAQANADADALGITSRYEVIPKPE